MRRIRWFHIASTFFFVLLLVSLSFIYLVKECHSEESQTLVALTFDDGYSSWTSTVMPILSRYGLPATAFILDPDIWEGEDFTWTDIQELYDAGWEIGSHIANNIELSRELSIADQSELISIFENCRVLFKDHGLPVPVSFAYPMGKHGHSSMEIVSDYFQAARTTHRGVNSPCSIRQNPVHLTTLGLKKGLSFIIRVVNEYSQQGILVILYVHTVGQTAEWQDRTEMIVQEFDDVAEYLHQKEEEGWIDVVTFSEGVRRMQERQSTSRWRLQLDSPFNPWYDADAPPTPERYSTLYHIVLQDFLGSHYPLIERLFDRLIYGPKHVGFYLISGIASFIVASIAITVVNLRRKKT